jgi:hypothetical protein
MRNHLVWACFLIVARLEAQSPSIHPAFERLKSIEGKWTGTVEGPHGPESVSLEYEVISAGKALMEKLTFKNTPSMVSIYHPDGRQLMMTHYCISANQPRVRTRQTEWPLDARDFEFFYLDATNVLSSDQMHIDRLEIHIQDENHLVQKWHDGKNAIIVTVAREGSPPKKESAQDRAR